jgi:hypothetical protein
MDIYTPPALELVQLLDKLITWASVQERQLPEVVPSFSGYYDENDLLDIFHSNNNSVYCGANRIRWGQSFQLQSRIPVLTALAP